MPAEPIPPAQPARTMAHTFAACSRNDDGSRLRAATHRRPSGRGRPQRTDPSTITSPASRPRTQISPGVRGRIGQKNRRPARNHSPPGPVDREALLQISRHAPAKPERTSVEKADDGDRTRDPQLGKLMLYQLSYVREARPV